MAEKIYSITEMAKIHHISRQTLIYYDKIDLFKPAFIDDATSYRYYSAHQIPILREICFEKKIGISLGKIKENMTSRNLENAIRVFEERNQSIDQELDELLKMKRYVEQKLDVYLEAKSAIEKTNQPFLCTMPERKGVFLPYQEKMTRASLHLSYMKILDMIQKAGMLSSKFFGSVLPMGFTSGDVVKGAGLFMEVALPGLEFEREMILPAGEYVCMYNFGMLYETEFMDQLERWIKNNGYQVVGPIFDACLLDNTFSTGNDGTILRKIQVPVRKI